MAPHSSTGKSHGQRSLVGCRPWGREESDTTELLHFNFSLSCIGEGNGNSLQCSCLENSRDGGAWWAAVYGVAQSRTLLKRLSSSRETEQIGGRWIQKKKENKKEENLKIGSNNDCGGLVSLKIGESLSASGLRKLLQFGSKGSLLTSPEDSALQTEPKGSRLGEFSHLGQGQHFELFRFSMNLNPKLHIMEGNLLSSKSVNLKINLIRSTFRETSRIRFDLNIWALWLNQINT